jgi:hypothetical protein
MLLRTKTLLTATPPDRNCAPCEEPLAVMLPRRMIKAVGGYL